MKWSKIIGKQDRIRLDGTYLAPTGPLQRVLSRLTIKYRRVRCATLEGLAAMSNRS